MGFTTDDVKRMFDFSRQYEVYGPWLERNGFTIADLPLAAKTEDGEDAIVEAYKDDDGSVVWKISVLQDNGWIRTTHYHKNGLTEEFYER